MTSQAYCKPLPVLVPPNSPYTRPGASILPFKGTLEVLEKMLDEALQVAETNLE